jgi:hypothetical protein
VPTPGGLQKGLKILIRIRGDEALEADETHHSVVAVVQEGVRDRARDAAVAVLKRVDDGEVEDEQADQQHRVVAPPRDLFSVSRDELLNEVVGPACRDRTESATTIPSIAEEAVMLSTRARWVSSVSRPGSWWR